MRWLPFFILVIIGIIGQTQVVPHFRFSGFGPNVLFILAVHYALWGPWPDGALAGLLLGLAVDVSTQDRIGLYAFCCGAASWAIIRIRQTVVRTHPVAQVLVTLLFSAGVEIIAALYHKWSGPERGLAVSLGLALLSAAYTAALAPVLLWLLGKLNRITGLRVDSRG